MSRQQRGGGDVARGAGYAALLGALLIGVAVVIGIVLLQIGDNNNNNGSTAPPNGQHTTTTKHVTTTTTTTTAGSGPTASTVPVRPPSQVRLIVLNGGAASGKAGDMSDSLKVKGYTNQATATDWTGHSQTGNTVYCREGFEREGTALAIAVGSGTKSQIPYPTPPPPYSSDQDCVVVVGG